MPGSLKDKFKNLFGSKSEEKSEKPAAKDEKDGNQEKEDDKSCRFC